MTLAINIVLTILLHYYQVDTIDRIAMIFQNTCFCVCEYSYGLENAVNGLQKSQQNGKPGNYW